MVSAPMGFPSIGQLNAMPAADFAIAVAPLFEGAPGFLDRLAAARPFDSLDGLFSAARDIVHAMPEAEQIALVDAHPRLGADPGGISAMSFREQGYDGASPEGGDDPAAARVARELERLNDEYEAGFGFRYCVFVAGRSRAELLPEMEAALGRPRDEELRRALDAVVDIAADRLRGLAVPESPDGSWAG